MPRRSPLGSSLTTDQLAWALAKGRRVTFRISGLDPITGYLAGMDDYHWAVIDPETLVLRCVHKSQPVVEIDPDSTYDDEPRRDDMERVIGPFRKHFQPQGPLDGVLPPHVVRAERSSVPCPS